MSEVIFNLNKHGSVAVDMRPKARVGIVNNKESKVDVKGYISPEKQIKRLLASGERYREYRQMMTEIERNSLHEPEDDVIRVPRVDEHDFSMADKVTEMRNTDYSGISGSASAAGVTKNSSASEAEPENSGNKSEVSE